MHVKDLKREMSALFFRAIFHKSQTCFFSLVVSGEREDAESFLFHQNSVQQQHHQPERSVTCSLISLKRGNKLITFFLSVHRVMTFGRSEGHMTIKRPRPVCFQYLNEVMIMNKHQNVIN